jgi:hypothetical protein
MLKLEDLRTCGFEELQLEDVRMRELEGLRSRGCEEL